MKGLDTNILLRLLVADDLEQVERVNTFFRSPPPDQLYFVNRIVLCELAWTLQRSYRFGREQVADAIDHILKLNDLVIDDYDAVSFALYAYQTSRADFADCLIGITNGFFGCAHTVTFDRRAAELDEFELI